MDRHAADIRAAHPYPTTDPLDRLRHTMSVYADTDGIAVQATSNIYPASDTIDGRSTGLTYSDLRALLERLGG